MATALQLDVAGGFGQPEIRLLAFQGLSTISYRKLMMDLDFGIHEISGLIFIPGNVETTKNLKSIN